MRTWTVDDVKRERPPIPIVVDGRPLLTLGKIIPSTNPWIIAEMDHKTKGPRRSDSVAWNIFEKQFSWSAVVEALNTPGVRLPIP